MPLVALNRFGRTGSEVTLLAVLCVATQICASIASMQLVEGLFWVFIGGPILIVLVCSPVFILLFLLGVIASPFNMFFEWLDGRSYKRQQRKEKLQSSGSPDPPLHPGTKVVPEKDQLPGSVVPVDPIDCPCGCGMWGRPLKSYDGHVSTCGCGTCHGIRRRNRERTELA